MIDQRRRWNILWHNYQFSIFMISLSHQRNLHLDQTLAKNHEFVVNCSIACPFHLVQNHRKSCCHTGFVFLKNIISWCFDNGTKSFAKSNMSHQIDNKFEIINTKIQLSDINSTSAYTCCARSTTSSRHSNYALAFDTTRWVNPTKNRLTLDSRWDKLSEVQTSYNR